MVGASCITRFLLLPLPLSSAHRKLVTRRIHDSCLPREGRVHQGVLPSKNPALGTGSHGAPSAISDGISR